MKIINKTKWRTDDLKAFAAKVLPLEIGDPAKRKKIVVTFVNARTRGVSGFATVNGTRCTIRVPSTRRANELQCDKESLAMVLAHEFAHLKGFVGGRSNELWMRGTARYGYRGDYKTYYAWAAELPVRIKEVTAKKLISPDAKYFAEIENIESLIAKWDQKRKRAETAIRKYKVRLAYRQKKLAAITAAKGGQP